MRALPFVFALTMTIGLAWPTAVRAQLECTGEVCSTIPISSAEYNGLFTELQTQYTRPLLERMAEALGIANLTTPQIGAVNLNDAWTIGANVGGGSTSLEAVDIQATGIGSIEDVPVAGGAINARLFAGVNLGVLTGHRYSPYGSPDSNGEGDDGDAKSASAKSPAWYSPARFDLYFSGLKHTERMQDEYGVSGQLRITTRTESFEVRYHLLDGKDLVAGAMLRFRGVSLGAGYAWTAQRLRYFSNETDTLSLSLAEGVNLDWIGQNYAILENNVRSNFAELRTGLQLIYFLNLTLAAGYAQSKGQVDFFATRFGPVVLSSDPLAQLAGSGITLPDTDAALSFRLYERGDVPVALYYGKLGLEFQILMLRLGVEGILTENSYGASLGVRFEF